MKSLIFISLCLVIIIPLVAAWLFRRRQQSKTCGYRRTAALFSPEERHLYALLRETVGEQFEVFGKIPVGEIIQPRLENRRQRPPDDYEEIAAHCFAFVLCDRCDFSVVAAVELQRRSSEQRETAVANDLLHSICAAAGLPLIAILPSAMHDPSKLRAAVLKALKPEPLPLPRQDRRKEPSITGIEGLDLE